MRRPLGFFLLAGFAAMLAALVVYSALKQREAQVRQATMQTVNIVVAAKDLSLGARIDPSEVELARWPRDSVPQGSFTDPASVVGSFVKGSFVKNEPIVAAKLFAGDKTAGVMPLLIPSGMRAMSVPVDEVSDIAGFVLPRAHVDVVVAIQSMAAGTQPFSKVVLQDVEVLAVAQEMEGPKDTPHVVKVVTLLVTPEQAEKLALASREGQLRLALRNYNDNKIVLTRGVDVRQMLGLYSTGLPTLTSQAVSPRHSTGMRRVKPLKTFKVEIMRDGKTDGSVSFIDQTRATRAIERGFEQTSAESGHEMRPSRLAALSHRAALGQPVPAGDGGARHAKTVSVGAPEAANPAPQAGFGPESRTIDIP
jgi:pilus assembly protein CpaB